MTTKGSHYIPEIDGLRAIAVGMVMLYHLSASFLPGGFSGVDVFFVISGYVVAQSLAKDAGKPFARFIAGFYARRILRIVPALLACLVTTAVLTTLFIPHAWLSAAIETTGLYAFFGMSNVAMVWTSDGYFSPKAEFNPFLHTWSLGVEEQFYLLFPLLLFAWLRSQGRGLAHWGTAAVAVASIGYAAYLTASDPTRAFYLLPSRFWELAAGAALFQYGNWKAPKWAMPAGLLLIAASAAFSNQLPFPMPGALLAVAGTALAISGTREPSGICAAFLRQPFLVGMGKVSYSFYLWHWPVYTLFRWTVGLETVLQYLAAVTITVVLAVASYRLWERPIREHRWIRKQAQVAVVMGGLACIGFSWFFASEFFARQWKFSLSVTRNDAIWRSTSDSASDVTLPKGCQTQWRARELPEGRRANIFERRCEGDTGTPQRLFILGDSHASAYGRLARHIVDAQGIDVWIYSKGGCALANLREPDGECAKLYLADVLQNVQAGDAVFLASLRMPRLGDQWGAFDRQSVLQSQMSPEAQALREKALQEADETLRQLEARQARVILDAPRPVFPAPPFRCSDWFNQHNPVCASGLAVNRELLLALRQPVMRTLEALEARHPTLTVWDTFDTLCPANPCRPFDGDKPLFFDGDHLSGYGNDVLYPQFTTLLRQPREPAKGIVALRLSGVD